MNRYLGLIAVLLSATVLGGCGAALFTDPKAVPIVEGQIGTLDIAANTAIRRLVYVRTESLPTAGEMVAYRGGRSSTGVPSRVGGYAGEFCAEPPPEAIEALASTFAAQASGNVTGAGDANAQLQAALQKQFATAVASTFRRSQGIQFYRDVSFAMCTAMLNGYIPRDEYIRQLYEVRNKAAEIMVAEFKSGYWNTPPAQPAVELPRLEPIVIRVPGE